MILNNKFYIDKLQTVVFFGTSPDVKKLKEINSSFGIKTIFIAGSDQSKNFEKNVKVNIFNNLNNKFKKLINKNCKIKNTLFISIGARYIFKKNTIEKFLLNNLVNFHGTRLPLDAGGARISWAVMREDRINNQLVNLITEGIDTGPIVDNKSSLYPTSCRIPEDLRNYDNKKFLEFYKQFIEKIVKGKKFELKHQADYLGRYNPRLNTKINGLIDWNLNSYDLINFINTFEDPYNGASTYLNNGNHGRLFIKKCQLHGGEAPNHPFMAGIVTRHDKDWIVVSTSGKHTLLVQEVLNQKGKNILSQIKPGDRFFTPAVELEKAKNKRIIYSSKGIKN
tara:strand:+ start:18585 stop:19595 length:1011 start_codon:yes stop_codon:yes gene_type:complete